MDINFVLGELLNATSLKWMMAGTSRIFTILAACLASWECICNIFPEKRIKIARENERGGDALPASACPRKACELLPSKPKQIPD